MTYQPGIPAATDIFPVSQGDLLTNFGQLNTIFNQDHVTFDAALGQGKHKFSTYTDQVGTEPTPAANELAAYAATIGGITSLRYRKDNTTVEYTLNPIKAFGLFTSNTGVAAQTITQNYNVGTINFVAPNFTVTLSEAMQNGATYAVFVNVMNQSVIGNGTVTITNSTQFVLSNLGNNQLIAFYAMEA